MTIRPLCDSDVPILREISAKSGYPYPPFDDPHIEAFLVVVDSEDRPIVACAAKRLIELYGYFDPNCSPTIRMKALGMLHEGMAEQLRLLGYNSVEAFLPPNVSVKFGRRLERTWGWVKNWQSWMIRF